MLDVNFPDVDVWLGVWEGKIGVMSWTPWPKTQFYLLLKGDGRHPNGDQVVMAFEALMGVCCLTGKPPRSPSTVLWDKRYSDDVWGGVRGDRRHFGDM